MRMTAPFIKYVATLMLLSKVWEHQPKIYLTLLELDSRGSFYGRGVKLLGRIMLET